jgi:hypothetical protein
MPKQSAETDLNDQTAERLINNSKNGSPLQVTQTGVKVREAASKIQRHESTRSALEPKPADDRELAAAKLLDQVDELPFHEFSRKAHDVLGESATVLRRKADLVEALEKLAGR